MIHLYIYILSPYLKRMIKSPDRRHTAPRCQPSGSDRSMYIYIYILYNMYIYNLCVYMIYIHIYIHLAVSRWLSSLQKRKTTAIPTCAHECCGEQLCAGFSVCVCVCVCSVQLLVCVMCSFLFVLCSVFSLCCVQLLLGVIRNV